jgi:hypothetical protein
MTSTPIANRFIALNNDDLLYNYYSYHGLHYIIDILKGFYDRYRVIGQGKNGQGKDPLFDKKCSMLKFEIVAHFCHYAEDLGAFLYPCHKVNSSYILR